MVLGGSGGALRRGGFRWGRGQEVPGEDPLVSSSYGEHFVKGLQQGTLYPKYLKTAATCKHFSAYDVRAITLCTYLSLCASRSVHFPR